MTRRFASALIAASLLTAGIHGAGPAPAVAVGRGPVPVTTVSAPARVPLGELFAVSIFLPEGVAAIDGRVTFRRGAADVVGIAATGGDHSFRPATTDAGASFGAFDIGSENGVRGVDLVLQPVQRGRLHVRIVLDTAVDATGQRVELPETEFEAAVQVGSGSEVIAAPSVHRAARPPRAARPVQDLQPDGRRNASDLDIARLAWLANREASALAVPTCAAPAATDANGDGCIDIADVQAVLAAETVDRQAAAAATLAANVLTVTSASDTPDANPGNGVCADAAGRCTLRAAMAEANWSSAEDRIEFALPGTAPVLIQLNGPLPSINARSAPMTIDGYSQPGSRVNTSTTSSNAIPGVELRGNGPDANEIGVYMTSANNTIRGLAFHNFYKALFIDGADAYGNRIVGNWFGFKRDGTSSTRGYYNITLNTGAHDNFIGTPDPADRNVTGNAAHGIEMYGRGVTGNTIQNNLVCMEPSGVVYAQCSTGIDHNFGPKNGLIGGTGPNERNVIGRTGLQGIEISHGWNPALGSANGGSIDWQLNGHRIIGNWIGFRGDGRYDATFRSATNDPGTGDNGQAVNVYDGSNDNLLEANYIASFHDGIQFGSSNAQRNTARGNFIGISPLGEAAPMSRWGIRVRLGTKLDVIEGNTIRNATLGGIGLTQNNVYQIRLTRNLVTDTPGWAIDLYGVPGPDANDPGDGDAGANSLLNTPIITSATTALVRGTGLAGAKVEVYRASRPAGQFGLPDLYLGQVTVASNGTWSLAVSRPSGERVTALQIRNDRDTSELSRNVLVGGAAANQPPTADFTTSCVALVCTFTDASDDADGAISSRAWSFGDGAQSSATNPVHAYAGPGTYTVALAVTDNAGAVASMSRSVTVLASGGLPMRVADLAGSTSIYSSSRWEASVAILVTDTNGVPIPNATVNGTFSRGGARSCVTAANGRCSVAVNLSLADAASTTFTVTSMSGPRPYDPASNVETSIQLNRP